MKRRGNEFKSTANKIYAIYTLSSRKWQQLSVLSFYGIQFTPIASKLSLLHFVALYTSLRTLV